jgi:hypothetical protein
MAAILRSELGEMLLLPPPSRKTTDVRSLVECLKSVWNHARWFGANAQPLPSPAELLYRVLVKGRTTASKHFGKALSEVRLALPIAAVSAEPPRPPPPTDTSLCFPSYARRASVDEADAQLPPLPPPALAAFSTPTPIKKEKEKAHPVAGSLSDVIYLQAVKFAGFDVAMEFGAAWIMSSIKVRCRSFHQCPSII